MRKRFLSISPIKTSKFVAYQALNEQLVRCQTAAEVEQIILNTPVIRFNDVNCSTAISMLGKKRSTNVNAIDTVLFVAKSKTFAPRHLSNICAGIATGKLQCNVPKFLLDQISNLEAFNSQDLANTLWSFAKLGHMPANDLCDRMAKHIIANPELLQGKQTDIALLIWSFVTLGYRDNDLLLSVFAKQICNNTKASWRAHNIANCLWAFATAAQTNIGVAEMTTEVCTMFAMEICKSQARDFNPQDLANTIWAFSTLRFKHEDSLQVLANKVCKRELGGSTSLSTAATATTTHHGTKRYAAGPEESRTFVSELMQKLKPPSVFASSNSHKLPILLEKLENSSSNKSQSAATAQPVRQPTNCFTPQNLTSTLVSFANLNFRNHMVIESIAKEICTRTLLEFQPQHIFNLIWAFACLDSFRLPPVREFFALQPSPHFEIEHQLHQAQQLFQTQMAWQHSMLPSSALLDSISENKWFTKLVENQDEHTSSLAHLNIAQLLHEQFPGKGEMLIETTVCGGLSVDILIPAKRVVIEIDGPTHFLHGNDEELKSGKTLFKHRLLQGEGYKVYSISVRKFEANPRKRTSIALLAERIHNL